MIPTTTRLIHLLCYAGLLLVVPGASASTNSADSSWLTRVWQVEDGLPQNRVNDVAQGQDGCLWVATAEGLARFDGVRFTKFTYRDEDEGSDQSIRKIVPGRDHGLWIVPMQGSAVHLNADYSQAFSPKTGLPGSPTSLVVVEDGEGKLWLVRSSSKTIVRIEDGKTTEFDAAQGVPTNGAVLSLVKDVAGDIWLAKGHSVSIFKQGRFEPVASFNLNAHLTPAHTHGVWIASGTELFKCDRQGHLQDLGPLPVDNAHTVPVVLMEDHAGAVWIGTDTSGLFRYSSAGFEKVETSYPYILCLAEDRENNIWVGTSGGGLNRISPRRVQLENFDDGTSPVAIQSVCEDARGTLWGATPTGLLVCRRDGQWIMPLTNNLEAVLSVAADRQGAVWIGARNNVLYCWRDNHLTTWNNQNGITSVNLTVLLPASNGDLWIAENSPDAVQCLHAGVLRQLTLPKRIGGIRTLAEDAAGNIWIGTSTGNLLRAEGDHLVDETALTGVADRPIWSLAATSDGALWIGYGGWGLGRLKDRKFAHLDASQGLPKDYISQLVADNHGWLWFGTTDHGIFKIRRDQLAGAMGNHSDHVRPVFYGRNEGLSSMEVIGFSPGATCGPDGRLWFPLRKSLAVVDPEIMIASPEPPPVLLSQVIMDGQTIANYGGLGKTQAVANLNTLNVPLRLPPSHRHLEFDFTAINLSAPENLHFRYQLVGFDNDWIEAEPDRHASYSRLTFGRYEFRVEACNGNGPWSRIPTTLALVVAPFFWQTWLFQVSALVLFTTIVIAIVRYVSFRRLQTEMRLLEQRAVLDKERTRIARDLHDDLGCSLNKVALTLDMTQRQLATTKTVNGEIEHCSAMVREVARSVDEIVWAINPRNDTLRYMADYISQFAVEFLHAADISCRVDLPDSFPQRIVSPEVRHNLFLVVKEALNNIARHAHATEVRLRINATDTQVVINLEDNGRGIESVPDNATSDGLRNMRQRMDEIGGRFQLETKLGAGTRVAFLYSWPPGDHS